MSGSYAALWCKSNYSFLEGASHPEELVEEAHRLGLSAIAITDRDGVYGVVRAHVKSREQGARLIIGSQLTVDDSSIVLLVSHREGYANLCRLITKGRLRSKKGECSVSWEEVCEHSKGLLAMWGGSESLLVQEDSKFSYAIADTLREAFEGRLYAMVTRHCRARELREEERLRKRAAYYGWPLVASTEVLYHTQSRRRLQDVLTCIRLKTTLGQAGDRIKPNAEHGLLSLETLQQRFSDDLAAIYRTEEVVSRCLFSLSELRYRYPSEYLPSGMTSAEWLRQLCFEGARKRYAGDIPMQVSAQIELELKLIDELDYCGYFLTMWEIVEFCRRENILCQGRGSAANSVVCYCLGITAIDPIRLGLLFERFISRERAEPPDIDLDIEHDRREEVIQHMYEKYGRSHAAMVANVIRYRAKSALRDVGKTLGMEEKSLDRMSKLCSHWSDVPDSALENAGLNPESHSHQLFLTLVHEIQDFPRHLSIHPGGFLLGHEPVHDIVPIENGTMEARTVIQWDKDDIEALGLFKVDLLGLGALTQLHMAFSMLEKRGIRLSIPTIPAQDAQTFEMIQRGDTVGVFQIESRAQMSMLPRLKPKTFYDLVVEVSIVRPGPITGGMVHPYLRRRNGEEAVDYPHECLVPVLEKTLGVPLFQEQVMRLAIVAADYSPGEADQLRRDMAAWRRSGRIERHRERLLARMQAKGISAEFAERVFQQIRGFGEYGFPESHAASFALIAYATSWLKCHYPMEFACALLNAQPMGFYAPSTIVEDAKRHDVVIHPVDVTRSDWDCSIEGDGSRFLGFAHGCKTEKPRSVPFIQMGLRYVKGLGEEAGNRIVKTRQESAYQSLTDFVQRTKLPVDVLCALAEAGAFESLGVSRRGALWEVQKLVRTREDTLCVPEKVSATNFRSLSKAETISWDYRMTSHSTHGHPLTTLRSWLRAQGCPDAKTVSQMKHGQHIRYAGLVICRQRPGTASGVTFMTLEDETGWVNVVVWRTIFESHAVLVRTASFLGVRGALQKESGVVHLVAEDFWIPQMKDAPSVQSRDFH